LLCSFPVVWILCVCVLAYVRVCVCWRACVCVGVCARARVCWCACVCVCVYVCVCTLRRFPQYEVNSLLSMYLI
jgi:hypothetical protein